MDLLATQERRREGRLIKRLEKDAGKAKEGKWRKDEGAVTVIRCTSYYGKVLAFQMNF